MTPHALRNVALAFVGRTSWHSHDDNCTLLTLAMWTVWNWHHLQLPRVAGKRLSNPPRSLQNVALALARRMSRHSCHDSCELRKLAVCKEYNCPRFQLPRMGRQEAIESIPFAAKCCSRFCGAHISALSCWQLYPLDTGNVESHHHFQLPRMGRPEGIESTPHASKFCSRFSGVHFSAFLWKVHNCYNFQLPRVARQEGIESTPFASKCCSRFGGGTSGHALDDKSTLWTLAMRKVKCSTRRRQVIPQTCNASLFLHGSRHSHDSLGVSITQPPTPIHNSHPPLQLVFNTGW